MSGNLPPGVTASDIDDHYGPSVPSHDHRWFPVEDQHFILEDGAAIFHYVCEWAPTKSVDMGMRGTEEIAQGPECGEERSIRLETAAEAEAVEAVEISGSRGVHDTAELNVVDIDPPEPGRPDGRLEVEADGYTVVYDE